MKNVTVKCYSPRRAMRGKPFGYADPTIVGKQKRLHTEEISFSSPSEGPAEASQMP